MTPEDKHRIQQWRPTIPDDGLRIRLIPSESAELMPLKEFCNALIELAPDIRLKKDDPDSGPSPGIRISDNITYQAVPSDQELGPFLSALAGTGAPIDSTTVEAVSKLQAPALIDIFMAPQCPYCPTVVSQVLSLSQANPLIHVNIVDGTLFSELAGNAQIRSVPTVILDDEFRWTGTVQLNEIVDMMLNRDPARLGSDTLVKMLQDGSAGRLGEMMVEYGQIFPAFLDLVGHPKWSIRLGAMVAFEYLAESDPQLAGQAVLILLDRFWEFDDQVRGDVLHLIGESGYHPARDRVLDIAKQDLSEEIREAAEEALTNLKRGS